MEGVERALYGFKSTKLQRFWFSIFYCCASKKQTERLFKGTWLKVEQAVEPELIIWENFGVRIFNRMFRIIFYIIFVFSLLTLCFYVVSILEQASNVAEKELSGVQCPNVVDAGAANLDFYANS